jgi:GntR family transcriptional regulator
VKRRPVQHLTVHISPEHGRLLMDVSIDTVNTLATGSTFHDIDRS